MIAEVLAAKSALASLSIPVYVSEAPSDAPLPRIILWTSAGARSLDTGVVPVGDVIDDQLGVTLAAETAEAVLVLAPQARALLTPTGVGSLTVTGRTVTLEHVEARAVQIDRDVTIPNTNRHPAYGVDLFRLVSIPS